MDARMHAWTNPVLPSLDALLAVLRLVAQWGDRPARLWQGHQTSLKGEGLSTGSKGTRAGVLPANHGFADAGTPGDHAGPKELEREAIASESTRES